MEQPTLPPLRLKKNEERRLRAGHLWIFSNEVDVERTPLTAFEPGDAVRVLTHGGRSVGTAYVNPHTLICARLMSRGAEPVLDRSLIRHRLNLALGLREKLYDEPFYRLVYGESDGLPGLVVDRFGDVLVVQLTTAGMERRRETVVEALVRALRPSGVLLRNDNPIRELEGLPAYVETAHGEVPEAVELREHGLRYRVAPRQGQKTGWYFDQHANRGRLARYARGARVLDAFSYIGGFGLAAAGAGAQAVLCVDASETALEGVRTNAALNGLENRVETLAGDAFDALKALHEAGERFDMVVLDPPAFIKRKKDLRRGTEAYRRLNQRGLRLLGREGFLCTASCSYHLPRATLREVLARTARHLDRGLQITEQGHQAPDHPVHPAIPETEYLKVLFARAFRS